MMALRRLLKAPSHKEKHLWQAQNHTQARRESVPGRAAAARWLLEAPSHLEKGPQQARNRLEARVETMARGERALISRSVVPRGQSSIAGSQHLLQRTLHDGRAQLSRSHA